MFREENTEFILWLETMRWPAYLQELDRQELMGLVEPPNTEEEELVGIVWDAMDGILQHCQQTVKQQAGYFLRMEAVRSEAK